MSNNESAQDKIVRLLEEKKAKQLAKLKPRKYIVEYFNDNKEVVARWHYNLDKFPNGPIMTENLEIPPKEKKSKKK